MEKTKTSNRAGRAKLLSLVSAIVLIPLFQNCGQFEATQFTSGHLGGAFDTRSGQTLPTSGGNSQTDTSLDGAALYATNCAACHGPLATSAKLGRSALAIQTAIREVSMMSSQISLVSLTQTQILAIEAALNGRAPSTPPTGSGPAATPTPISQTPVGICATNAVRGLSKEGVRRLSRDELKASLDSVVPGLTEGLRAQLDVYPDTEVVEEVEKYDVLHSESQVYQWAQVVDAIATRLTPQYLASSYGNCLVANPINDACWKSFFTSFGRKVYRRPLSTTEVATLASLVQRRPNPSDAMYAAVHLLFRSPAFLFHLELGASEESGRVRLSDHEVANRISFGILGTPPDAALAAAADAGQVRTLAQVETQVKRLIGSDAAKVKMTKFVSEWLQLSHIQPPQNEYMVFLKSLGGNGDVDRAFKQEIQDYMYYMIFKKRGNFTDLMTAPIGFPRYQGLFYSENSKPFSALAGIYGDDKFANFTPEGQAEALPFPAPNNPGLLTRAGFMSSAHYETQPITRGVFIQRRILCEPLPSPDFSVVSQRLSEVGTLDPLLMANHEIVSAKTSATACASCHSKINPVGFALEGLDMIGKLRVKQEVIDITKFYSEKHGIVATFNLPTPVNNVLVGEKTVSVSGPADLAQQVASSSRAKLCMSTFVLRHFDRRRENGGDSCRLAEATQSLQDGKPILDVFVKTMANEDIFWRRK